MTYYTELCVLWHVLIEVRIRLSQQLSSARSGRAGESWLPWTFYSIECSEQLSFQIFFKNVKMEEKGKADDNWSSTTCLGVEVLKERL